jgi:nitrite reductase/ring-hydroxylating ferredoxin subunit
MSHAADMLSRLRSRLPTHGLPGIFYRDPELYALELELIFYAEWLFAAHTVELQQAGSYLTLQVGDYPILLTRDRDGLIHAFVNSCRHRGARVCQESHGVVPKLVCPYHQWTYELELRSKPVRPEADSLRDGRGLHLHLRGLRTPRLCCHAAPDRAVSAAASADRSARGLRVHHSGGGQLEAGLGKQPGVLPLCTQPSAAERYLSGQTHNHQHVG